MYSTTPFALQKEESGDHFGVSAQFATNYLT